MLVCLGIFTGLFLCELYLRIIYNFSQCGPYMKFRHAKHFYVPKQAADADLFWRPLPEFRGVKYSLDKKDDVFRVICLGDSVTQSHGKNGFPLEISRTYPYELESLFRRKRAREKVEVINAGIGGYTSLQSLRYLKKELWKYRPDLIIAWCGMNDDSTAIFFADKEQRLPSVGDLKKLGVRNRSALYLYLKKELSVAKKRRVEPDDYYRNCEEMLLFGRGKELKMVFVVPFEIRHGKLKYYAKYKEALDKLRKKYNIELLDVKSILDTYGDVGKLFIDNCHLTAEGNKIVAGIIYNLLQRQLINAEEIRASLPDNVSREITAA